MTACSLVSHFSHHVTAAILVSQNNETAAMLVSQTNPLGTELFSYANAFFCPKKLHRGWPREWKHKGCNRLIRKTENNCQKTSLSFSVAKSCHRKGRFPQWLWPWEPCPCRRLRWFGQACQLLWWSKELVCLSLILSGLSRFPADVR